MYISVLMINSTEPWVEYVLADRGIWVGLATAFWAWVFIVTNSIPSFSSIIGVSSALLVGWFSFGIPGIFWLHLNKGRQFANIRMICLAMVSYLLIAIALFFNTAGMWASITSLINLFNGPSSKVTGPFTCADNSLF